jgi:iron complex outermembrane receptor protein
MMNIYKFNFKQLLTIAFSLLLTVPLTVSAQAVEDSKDDAVEEVVVTGIRSALASAVAQKRSSDNLIEVIVAEDIGKLPDQLEELTLIE